MLILHGLAGSIWMPAEQLMLYDYAGKKDLPSDVRINATFRSLGFLLGPVVGSVLVSGSILTVGACLIGLWYISKKYASNEPLSD